MACNLPQLSIAALAVAFDLHSFSTEFPPERFALKKVLVVDDSAAELKLIESVLEQGGFRTTLLSDPSRVEETIESERPNIILLDVVMPGRNGFQLCRELKNHEVYGTIPVILVSSKSSASDKYWGEQQGANGYVCKPFTPDELIRAVKRFA
jgi:twitching motility two-component system response regulator PilH